jgi:hypothetical protein
MGFESVYEGEVHIRIRSGIEIGRRQHDNRKQKTRHLARIF